MPSFVVFIALLAVLAASCGGAPISEVRYYNREPVEAVNDRLDVADKPEENPYYPQSYLFDTFIRSSGNRVYAARESLRARGVNSLGEVPDSTWYTNRVDHVRPEDLARGPNRSPDPRKHKPWTILSSKLEGAARGFIVEDSRGQKHLLKLGEPGFEEAEIGAHMIAHRLFWALGYNVPEDRLVWVSPDELVLTDQSVVKEVDGDEHPLTRTDVRKTFAGLERDERGRVRALLSQFVPGVPLGGYPMTGTRDGDPNDLIPHQMRRDVRGLKPMFAWFNHSDVKESNTLDTWLEDPHRPGVHYVRHYLIDFGKALGVLGLIGKYRDEGYRYVFDLESSLQSLLSLGIVTHEWEAQHPTDLPAVGIYRTEGYDPGEWTPRLPYHPFSETDRFDSYWGAKKMMKLGPAHLREAVRSAQFSDPRTRRYLYRTLLERQRMTARYWFRRVNPVDEPEMRGRELCFVDLALAYNLETEDTVYRYQTFETSGRAVGPGARARAGADGKMCIRPRLAAGDDGYSIVLLRSRRESFELPAVEVHLARHPATRKVRVVGLRRH